MHTDNHGEVHHHHHNKHRIETFERMLGVAMVIAVILLAAGLVWGFMDGNSVPSYLR